MMRHRGHGSGVSLLCVSVLASLLFTSCTATSGDDIQRPASTPSGDTTIESTETGTGGDDDLNPADPVSTPSGGTGSESAPVSVPSKGVGSESAGPVPAPGSGNVSEKAPSVAIPEPITTGLLAQASPIENVTVELVEIDALETSAKGPGQVAGPALVVTVLVKNESEKPVDTSGVEVSLEDSAGNPGSGVIGEPASWFKGSVDPGMEGTGVYVFTVAESERETVSVSFTLRPGTPAVLFEGAP